jgi:hypothetical protein
MSLLKTSICLILSLVSAAAAAADARDRGFLSTGMSEGEVVFKIGPPDHEAFIKNIKGQPEEKTWTYFPHPRDPQTLTLLTLRAGTLTNIERKVAR